MEQLDDWEKKREKEKHPNENENEEINMIFVTNGKHYDATAFHSHNISEINRENSIMQLYKHNVMFNSF